MFTAFNSSEWPNMGGWIVCTCTSDSAWSGLVVAWLGGPTRRELPSLHRLLEALLWTCAPAGWPRRMPSRKLRL